MDQGKRETNKAGHLGALDHPLVCRGQVAAVELVENVAHIVPPYGREKPAGR